MYDDIGNKITTAAWSSLQPITVTSGSVTLEANTVYTMTINGNTSFVLPTPTSGVLNQIKIMAQITGTPTISWGTTKFFGKTTPEISVGYFDIYFDYDPWQADWVVGVISKGAAA